MAGNDYFSAGRRTTTCLFWEIPKRPIALAGLASGVHRPGALPQLNHMNSFALGISWPDALADPTPSHASL
jgi:hypothetical protein